MNAKYMLFRIITILTLISLMIACSAPWVKTPTPKAEESAQAPLVEATELPRAPEVEQQPAVVETVIVTQVVTVTERVPVEFDPTSDWWDKLNECAPQKDSTGEYLDSECKLEGRSELTTVNDVYRLMKNSEGKYYEGTTILVIEPAIGQDEASPYYKGLGTRWSVDPSECPEGYTCDVLNETISHAIRRLDQGHSGIVVYWNPDIFGYQLVANLRGLDESGIMGYWKMYQQAYADEGYSIDSNLQIPDEAIGKIYPPEAEAKINEIYGSAPAALSTGTCGPANVDELPWNNPTASKNIQAVTVTNTYDSILVFRPWWDPANRFPLFTGGDPSTAIRQGQIVLYPNQSVTGDWNGGPIVVYPTGCTIEQVLADARRSGSSWPFMYVDPTTKEWVELPADQNTWPLAP